MLSARTTQGWREPIATLSGQLDELRKTASLLTTPGRWTAELVDVEHHQLTVEVRAVDSPEPVDDIGEPVLRARLVAPDRIEIEISEAGIEHIGRRLSTWLADLGPGGHAHLEWFHPVEGEVDDRSPWIAWVFEAEEGAASGNG